MEIGQNIRFPDDFFPGGAMTFLGFFPSTNSVDRQTHGFSEVMTFHSMT
jgi:hypothetical protein